MDPRTVPVLEIICLVIALVSIVLAWRSWRRRRDLTRAFTWHFASHDGGKHVHAIPDYDGFHVDDHREACRCGAWTERFERPDGSYGEAIYHRRIHAGVRRSWYNQPL